LIHFYKRLILLPALSEVLSNLLELEIHA